MRAFVLSTRLNEEVNLGAVIDYLNERVVRHRLRALLVDLSDHVIDEKVSALSGTVRFDVLHAVEQLIVFDVKAEAGKVWEATKINVT